MSWTTQDEISQREIERTLAKIKARREGGRSITEDRQRAQLSAQDAERRPGQPVVQEPAPLNLAQEIINIWETSPEIRAEFGSLACYAAYRKAEAAGKARIIGGKVQRYSKEEKTWR